MLDTVNAVNLLTFVWLTGWAIYSLTAISRGERRSIHFVLLVFFAFCGLPLAADVFFDMPPYEKLPNYYRATRDATTCLVYCVWMASVPPLCFSLPRQQRSSRRRTTSNMKRPNGTPRLTAVMLALLPTPFLLACFAPDPNIYMSYAAFLRLDPSPAMFEYHHQVAAACLLVSLAASGLIAILPHLSGPHVAIIAAALLQAVWLHGKRSILVICVLGVIYGLWYRGYLRGPRLYITGFAVGLILIGVNILYQGSIREFRLDERSAYYDGIRIDFGRDGVIKQAIYAELYPDASILDHRAQSLLFYSTFFVPRDMWPEKPWPYAVYVTAAALDMPGTAYLGWGVTSSFLDEFLANFGWVGMILAPLWMAFMCRLGDGLESPLAKTLWIVLSVLFMAVHLTAFMLPFLVWWGVVLWNWCSRVWFRYHEIHAPLDRVKLYARRHGPRRAPKMGSILSNTLSEGKIR